MSWVICKGAQSNRLEVRGATLLRYIAQKTERYSLEYFVQLRRVKASSLSLIISKPVD